MGCRHSAGHSGRGRLDLVQLEAMVKREAPDWFGCGKTITQESWDGFMKAKHDYFIKKDAEEMLKALEAMLLVGEHLDQAQRMTIEALFPVRFKAARDAIAKARKGWQ